MGSPLSPLLADIYMDDFEEELFNNTNFQGLQFIHSYQRYVDDILIIWKGTTQDAMVFLDNINSMRENIKFEIEIGGETINFLDLTIYLNSSTSHLEFKIYRKPTVTDTCIPNDSVHPHNHKMAAFRAYFWRLLEVPMSENNFKTELDIIFQIAINNGYQKTTIQKLFYFK